MPASISNPELLLIRETTFTTGENRMNKAGKLILLGILNCSILAAAQSGKEPVDYVSPNIGGIGQLLTATIPYVQYPHGMARLL